MADRLVGLLGPGRGPMVPMWHRRSKARITGLRDGQSVTAHVELMQVHMECNGLHELPRGEYVQFEHLGESHALQCEVLTINAISSD